MARIILRLPSGKYSISGIINQVRNIDININAKIVIRRLFKVFVK